MVSIGKKNFKCIALYLFMEFTSEAGSDFFLAVALSIFTFCFVFLGVQLQRIYYIAGLGCLIAAIWYWVKVKKTNAAEF